jgi:alpha-glucosidase
MITRLVYGVPFETEAITQKVPETDTLRHFRLERSEKSLTFFYMLDTEDVVYGLGETMGAVNKRGGRYISFNTDTADHTDSNPSLYASHNLLIVDGREKFGVFFDTPARITFEIDYRGSGEIRVVCDTVDLAVYQLEGDSSYGITREFLRAIGRAYLPPLWAFGYGQSRFGYKCEKDFRDVLQGHRDAGISLDYICMDIDYMDRFIDFSVNEKNFPDLKAFSEEMSAEGIHLVPIVDAGIKVEPGNETYESGIRGGYFCRNKEGGLFRACVWPGMTHFPDFLNPKAREWFGGQYKFYTDRGIEGFWNDMNEPAIFYSEYTKGNGKLNMILNMVFPKQRKEKQARDLVRDYKSFFHSVGGKRYRHYDVHNIYGYLMTRASAEGLKKLLDHRFLLFSRSSYIGAGRYGGVWTGDNSSCWEHLKLNVRHMPSLNMCGFLYSGADTGGFMGNTNRELLLRWLAVSAFTPLMRNHTGNFTANQEAYQFGDPAAFRSIISLRYRLLPYIYSEYMKAALTGDMYIKPLAFVFPGDPACRAIEDQLVVGDSVMITPIIKEGARERRVYLPQAMTQVRYDGENFTCQAVEKGWITIRAELDEVVFFVLKDKLLPIGKAIANTREVDFEDLTLLGDGQSYDLYVDDGLTRDCTLENVRKLER